MRRRPLTLASVLAPLALLAFAAAAHAEAPRRRPQTGYRVRDLRPPRPQPAHEGPWIIYMNREGGAFTGTWNSTFADDSRRNLTSMFSGSATLPAFSYGDVTWNQVMQCMKEIYAPFDVTITDIDPGDMPHIESVVAGNPEQLGLDPYVGGISPYTCYDEGSGRGVIENSIVFTFAGTYNYANNARDICETAAQEVAHSFGLDHEYLCKDPMTYLYGCGNKSFQDVYAACGEDRGRNCQCGGSQQNSVVMLRQVLGERPPMPPTVAITTPRDGGIVTAGFTVDVDAQDDVSISHVEAYIDGSPAGDDNEFPYAFTAPADLAEGGHEIVVRAWDVSGLDAEVAINVNLRGPCVDSGDCGEGGACVEGRCVAGPGTPGGLGERCVEGPDCSSGVCGADGDDHFCTEACTPGVGGVCPSDFSCRAAEDGSGVCWPKAGGCCGVAGGAATPIPWAAATPLVLGLLGMLALGRRRRG